MLGGAKQYVILVEGLLRTLMRSYFQFGSVVQEEMSFIEKVYARTADGRRPITVAHLEPMAQVS